MMKAVVLAVLVLLGTARAAVEMGPSYTELAEIPSSDYAYDPPASASNSAYGSSSMINSKTWSTLAVRDPGVSSACGRGHPAR